MSGTSFRVRSIPLELSVVGRQVDFFGIRVTDAALSDVVTFLGRRIRQRMPTHVVALNPQLFVLSERYEEFQEICRSSELVIADGVGVALAAGCRVNTIPNRYSGMDLMLALCTFAEEHGLSVFLAGGVDSAALRCLKGLHNRFPSLRIVGTFEPPVVDRVEQLEDDAFVHAVNAARPDIVFVALGAPKQEKWIHRNRHKLDASLMLGVGGSFDVIGGLLPRAPRWMRSIGLEWLFRLILEPRRLAGRYLLGIPHFLYLVLRLRFQSHS